MVKPLASRILEPSPSVAPEDSAFRMLIASFASDMRRGRHVVLWGPRGSGKTTLLNAVLHELGDVHCAFSASTASLDDITRALERAYTAVPTRGLKRRAARARLWRAADVEPGCLLLDHVTRVPAAMKGWLRRLRGGLMGVVLAIDVDSPRERERLRSMKIGSTTFRMPPAASGMLSGLLKSSWAHSATYPLPAQARRLLVRAARGRPGWVTQCVALASDRRYWREGQLKTELLVLDTEIRLRAIDASTEAILTQTQRLAAVSTSLQAHR
jgi:ATPase family associated with various cellular activities (AAA)